MKKVRLQLSIVLFQEGPYWVAQALERDLNAQGARIEQALDRLTNIIAATAELDIESGREPLEDLPPAPPRYFQMFVEANRLERPESACVQGSIPAPWMIETLAKDMSRLIQAMHDEGSTIIETIKAVRSTFGVGLRDAKAAVSRHPAWSRIVEAAQPLHDAVVRMMDADCD
jgi:hypothetical protein